MLKDTTCKEKFKMLKEWMPDITETVKKELKNEHLKKDWSFAKKYFSGKNLNKITINELSDGYFNAITTDEKGEEIAEFVSNCWLLNNSEIYDHFENALKKVSEDFSTIEKLEPQISSKIRKEAEEAFGAYKVYLFSILNSVAFQETDFASLKEKAAKEFENLKNSKEETIQLKTLNEIENHYKLTLARASDKYEKKILGLQKKYAQDTSALKKQVVSLQTALNRQKACSA